MGKIWTLAWRELYVRFTDRNLMLIVIATPLAISSIVGLAFGGLSEGRAPVREIPLAVVNHDRGTAEVRYGDLYLSILLPGTESDGDPLRETPACELLPVEGQTGEDGESVGLYELTEAIDFDEKLATELIDRGEIDSPPGRPGSPDFLDAAAKAAVDRGVYTAALLIPEGFSERLTAFAMPGEEAERTVLTLYANGGRPIAAGILLSIVRGITDQILTGQVTIAATFSEMAARGGPAMLGRAVASLDFERTFACAFTPSQEGVALRIERLEAPEGGASTASRLLVNVGSAQAMFFALFTAQFGVLSMHEDRRQWTLQRLIMSPTPRSSIMAGKLIGVFATVLVQLLLLMLALTLVGSLLGGAVTFIWGSNIARIALVLLAVSLAVSGFGMLLAGIVKDAEQAQVFTTVINMAMAVLGGAFGFTLPRSVSQFSLLYWGRDAFDRLAVGQGEIGLHAVVLALQGVVMFLVGLWLFNRRFEV
jgi:ABC-type Na+ efflux pump permease subunit